MTLTQKQFFKDKTANNTQNMLDQNEEQKQDAIDVINEGFTKDD